MSAEKILVIEDDTDNRLLLCAALQRYGYEVLSTVNALDALDLLETSPVHLILLDMHLPKMSGFEFLDRIKKQPHTQQIPVIAITANSITAERGACLRAGCVEYVTKPFMRQELHAVIEKVLNSFA